MIREGVRERISRDGAMDQRSREGIYLHLTEHNVIIIYTYRDFPHSHLLFIDLLFSNIIATPLGF